MRARVGQVEVCAPADLDIRRACPRAVQKMRHVRRGAWLRRGLGPTIDMGGEHRRRVGRRRIEVGKRIAACQRTLKTSDAEVHFAFFVPVRLEPLPGFGQRFAVNRVGSGASLRPGFIGANEDRGAGCNIASHPVQPPEALAQGVEAGALRNQGVEIEVGPDFQSLGGDDDDGLLQVAVGGPVRVKVQFLQPPDCGVPVHGPHSTGEQDGGHACVVPQYPVNSAGGRHTIDEYHDGPPVVAQHIQGSLRQLSGEAVDRIVAARVRDLSQRGGFAGQLPPAEWQTGVAPFVGFIPEHVLQPRRRRRGHHHRMEATPQGFLRPCLSAETPDGLQGLEEGPRTMRFVQQNETVVGHQSGIDRPCTGAAPVSAEQQTRPDLIHRRRHDHRLQRIARPCFRAVHTAAQGMDGERQLVFESGRRATGDTSQPVGDDLQNTSSGVGQLLRQPARPLMRFVYDHPSVDHEEDAARGGDQTPGIRPRRLNRQGEKGDIHARGLAGRGGQGDGLGPRRRRCLVGDRRNIAVRRPHRDFLAFQHPLRQFLLPAKGRFIPQPGKEFSKVFGAQMALGHRCSLSTVPRTATKRLARIPHSFCAHRGSAFDIAFLIEELYPGRGVPRYKRSIA